MRKVSRATGTSLQRFFHKAYDMIRAIAFAGGLFVGLCGSSFLLVDEMVLNLHHEAEEPRPKEFRGMFMHLNEQKQKVFTPPQWLAFTLMSIGSVTMLYSIALPKKPKPA